MEMSMNYIKRYAERKFLHLNSFFKAVLVTGARQVGKTTMLRHLAEGEDRTYVSLDNIAARNLAIGDPDLFFQTYKLPILIDEIQYAPNLFPKIKILCDESEETGLIWMTGSQSYSMMKNVQESLAGRVGIVSLYGLSFGEIKGYPFDDNRSYALDYFQSRQKFIEKLDVAEVFEHIHRGGMPQVQLADAEQRQEYYNSYINTFIMRDVAELGGVTDTVRFGKFLAACAALTSEQLNYATLAENAGTSQPTAKTWIDLLEGLGIIYLLQPFSNNELKRVSKTPKLYFCDTGLCAHLSRWLTKDALMLGAANGDYFENHVVMEMKKYYAYASSPANIMFFRDSNKKEIDLIVENGNIVYPFEIKHSSNPNPREVKKFTELDKTTLVRGSGGVICLCEEVIPVDHSNCFIPCTLL
jgi:predicted AAA+ superfamily ATPase